MRFEAETRGIVVRVEPMFLAHESEPAENRFLWAYTIEIENRSAVTVQLLARHWRITDDTGFTQDVRGPGVVGETPVLEPGDRFRYTSGCPLAEPAGVMVGSYQMIETASGAPFDIAIPAFPLDSPYTRRMAN